MSNDVTNSVNALTFAMSLRMEADKDLQKENAIALANNICARLGCLFVGIDAEFADLKKHLNSDDDASITILLNSVDDWSKACHNKTVYACTYMQALCVIREIFDSLGMVSSCEYEKLSAVITMFRNLIINFNSSMSRAEVYTRVAYVYQNNLMLQDYIQEHEIAESIADAMQAGYQYYQEDGETE